MRDTVFNAIKTKLLAISKFVGADGTVRVYDYPETTPAGYPYVVLSSAGVESAVLDSQRDQRTYMFNMYIVGEKFGEQEALTQSDALKNMRHVEDAVLAAFDGDNRIGLSNAVLRTTPTKSTYGYTDGGTRVILNIEVNVDIPITITF